MALKKLPAKRLRKDAAGEDSREASQVDMDFDGHKFQSEEHQQRLEAIKGWSFLKERRVQPRDGEYTKFQEEISRKQWTQLVSPMAKYDLEIVMEFYANAWPTEVGVRDKCSWVRGHWIPFDEDTINQFLGHPLVLEEGQCCEYSQRRSQASGFDEEAISQLLCVLGQHFSWSVVGRQVQIMSTNMTTLTQIWMTLLLSNILPPSSLGPWLPSLGMTPILRQGQDPQGPMGMTRELGRMTI